MATMIALRPAADTRPVIFGVFNARFVDPKDVASGFVLSPFLDEIVAPSNIALLGPRGSGKTTLLKMLTLPALLNWGDSARDAIAAKLDSLAVYVPYNLTSNADYRAFSRKPIQADVESILSVALFRHSVLRALLETWLSASNAALARDRLLSKFHLPIDEAAEPELVRSLARAWDIPLRISTVSGLRESISNRVRDIQKLTVRSGLRMVEACRLLEEHSFLAAHFVDDCVAFADFLQEHYNFCQKISLCFDELEIAADAVATAILQAPRSLDQRFFIKFSAAPYISSAVDLLKPRMATQRNDYHLIFLSSFSTRETRQFSEALFVSLCKKRDVEASASEILGDSFLDVEVDEPNREEGSRRYSTLGTYQRVFANLHSTDDSFRRFLEERSWTIDINDLTRGSEKQRAAAIRKILWPVLIRQEFLFKQEQVGRRGQRRRFRSLNAVADIYTGAGSLFALCEGNPRSIIGLLGPMIEAYLDASGRPVKRSVQKDLVEDLIGAYFALISTYPSSNAGYGLHSLLDMVYRVGSYFNASILGREFNADPVTSFFVDDEVPDRLKDLVGHGINIGAFVTTNKAQLSRTADRKVDPFQLGDVSGLKVRLSNIFAPQFRLSLAGGRTINLSTILTRTSAHPTSKAVLELFGTKL
jgi:hypothetical protein